MPWQPANIVFPDAELLMTTRTRVLLDDPTIFVHNRVPNPRVPWMVIWNRDGGAIAGLRDQPRMRARVCAPTDDEANELAQRLIALVLGMPDGNPILHTSHESGPIDVPDASLSPLKYVLFNVHTRGAQQS